MRVLVGLEIREPQDHRLGPERCGDRADPARQRIDEVFGLVGVAAGQLVHFTFGAGCPAAFLMHTATLRDLSCNQRQMALELEQILKNRSTERPQLRPCAAIIGYEIYPRAGSDKIHRV